MTDEKLGGWKGPGTDDSISQVVGELRETEGSVRERLP